MTHRNHLRLVNNNGPEMPPLRLHVTHRSLHTVAAEIVEAAQDWTAYMVGSGALERIDPGTEYGKLTLVMTDRVTEYEFRMTGGVGEAPEPQTQNGPVTLW
jgi:hypothetical protein